MGTLDVDAARPADARDPSAIGPNPVDGGIPFVSDPALHVEQVGVEARCLAGTVGGDERVTVKGQLLVVSDHPAFRPTGGKGVFRLDPQVVPPVFLQIDGRIPGGIQDRVREQARATYDNSSEKDNQPQSQRK